MVSHFLEHEPLLQNSIFNGLYCEEERFDEDLSGGFGSSDSEIEEVNEIQTNPFPFLYKHDLFWVDEELLSLLSKEKKQGHLSFDDINSDGSLKMVRNEAVKWLLKVIAHYGFTSMTAVLAVNYYDRFISSLCFHNDKPWMSQLAAVACLSIAAKMEETQVPLLTDLQVEESKYLFEAKTIQRMELLVLSSLQWKMNPVTPIEYFDHIARRMGLITNICWEFLRRCRSVVRSMITDYRIVCYLPSVIASAIMLFVIRDIEPCKAAEFKDQLIIELKTSKEKIAECLQLITEVMHQHGHNRYHKRKHASMPSSPSCVVDVYFSSESSNDSWEVASSGSSSPEIMFKRIKAQDQHMTLAPQSSVCWHG